MQRYEQVRAQDWRAALSAAQKPCSLRSALQSDPYRLLAPASDYSPALLQCLAQLLAHCHSCCVPMTAAVQHLAECAADAVTASIQQPTDNEGTASRETDTSLPKKLIEHLTHALDDSNAPALQPAGSQELAAGVFNSPPVECDFISMGHTKCQLSCADWGHELLCGQTHGPGSARPMHECQKREMRLHGEMLLQSSFYRRRCHASICNMCLTLAVS